MTAYLDVPGFTQRTTMPSSDVALVDSVQPGYIAARIAYWQEKLDARLRKRYAVPFAAPVPEVVLGWLADLITPDIWTKRGVDSSDPMIQRADKARDTSWGEVLEAANSETGLYDLPLREDLQTSGITAGGPLGQSQVSCYDWVDDEAEALNGTGG